MIGLSRLSGIVPGIGLAAFVFASCGTNRWEPNTLWINEVMPRNKAPTGQGGAENLAREEASLVAYGTDTDADPYENWIELYNASDSDVDLSEYSLADGPESSAVRVRFGPGPKIKAGGFLLVWMHPEPSEGETLPDDPDQYHLSRTLDVRDELYLYSPNGQLLDAVAFQHGKDFPFAFARFPDGKEGQWVWCKTASPGTTNGDSCETPYYRTADAGAGGTGGTAAAATSGAAPAATGGASAGGAGGAGPPATGGASTGGAGGAGAAATGGTGAGGASGAAGGVTSGASAGGASGASAGGSSGVSVGGAGGASAGEAGGGNAQ